MKNLAVRLVLYCGIALIPISCGTRKSAVKILKNAEVVTVKEENKAVVIKSSEVKEAVKESVKSENVDEDKTVVVTELYNEHGVIKSRVVSINTNKKSNNTLNTKESLKQAKKESDSTGSHKSESESKVTSYSKEKTTTRKNDGWYYVVGIIGVIALAFWFKPWKK